MSQTQNFSLLAVPLFIFAGNVMNRSGITRRLLTLATVLTGRMRGGLAEASLALSALTGGLGRGARRRGDVVADDRGRDDRAGHQPRVHRGAAGVRRGADADHPAGDRHDPLRQLTPIVLPLIRSLGGEPVHFGIVFIVAATLGNFMPPVGAAMYAVCSILKVPVGEYSRESVPLIVALTLVVVLLVFIPDIVLFP